MSESTVIKKLKSGSREALALLWQEHSCNMLNLAFRMMKDRDQAEDVLMDVFVQVPQAIKNFKGNSAIATWLYKLTVNACLMKLRTQKRHHQLEEEHIDNIIEDALGKVEDTSTTIQNPAAEYDPELLALGLNELSTETRSMLWLKDAEDLDIKDLAEIFRLPEGTIKARLSRGRNFLRTFIKERKIYA